MKSLLFILVFITISLNSFSQNPTGGPDSYGYTWRTNDDPLGPVYQWIDLPSLPGAVQVTGLNDDNYVGSFPIGFLFEYYGTLFNEFQIGSNGYLHLGTSGPGISMSSPFPTIPNANNPSSFIAPMATDLYFDSSTTFASVWYWNSPGFDSLVVSWLNVPLWSNNAPGYTGQNSFQVILKQNTKQIVFQYKEQSGLPTQTSNFVTIGIEAPDGLTGLNPYYDVYPDSGTCIQFDIGEYNKVTGHLFLDLNSNNIREVNEPPVAGKIIANILNNTYAITNSNGGYVFSVLDSSNYEIYPPNILHFVPTPLSHSGYLAGPGEIDSLSDFSYNPVAIFDDLSISIGGSSVFRPGFTSGYFIRYANYGTTVLNPEIVVHFPPALSFVSCNTAPAIISNDSLVFQLSGLQPFQSGLLHVRMKVDSTTALGTQLLASAQITPIANDTTPDNNIDSVNVIVSGAVDPNDIGVNLPLIPPSNISNPPLLEYLISFQNTGNDTALNVYLVNDLPALLDITTFELIGATHPVGVSLDAATRQFIFSFSNILLPDSATNEAESRGSLLYRVRPLSTLQLNDTIINQTDIYFDFNQPVITNTAITVIANPVNTLLPAIAEKRMPLIIYPNPANENITVMLNDFTADELTAYIYDSQGRVLKNISLSVEKNGKCKVDIDWLTPGCYVIEIIGEHQKLFAKFMKY